jgi:hypothetical protein
MPSPGRHDPCPCGSGRKHKDCCGKNGAPDIIAASSTRDSALAKLLTYAFHPAFDSDHTVAEVMFWGNLIRDAASPEFQWVLDSEDATIKYNTWFLLDWEADDSGTVIELFLEEADAKLTPAEREFLTRLAHAPLRLYEVESVEPGDGVRLIDLWTCTPIDVIERTASRDMVRWDVLGARVAPDGMDGNVFEGGLYLYPVEAKAQVLRHFRRLYRRHHRRFPLEDAASFFHKHGAVFHHLWLSLVIFPEPPQIVTSDGDPLVFCRSVFETEQPEEVQAAVAAHPRIRATSDGTLAWRETTPDGEVHEGGTWSFEGKRVVFETTSKERAARGRAWLEALVGDRVRFRAMALETLEQTMDELRRDRPRYAAAFEEETPTTHEEGAVRELFDRHYHSWLDRPVPALGNRTPRAAARTPLWRRKVVDLLKQFENTTDRAALHGRPPYDFRWIWRALDLDR